ncbi:phage tail tape measure protein [Pseudomonas sp. 681]|uniref:Phage tail tape measure protein n=1 Tax=Pseudomonas fungipugnans TaxID=3024217 RepID=A0ABT6QGM8_9PSED|nr:phage tail tape measure protein [Pseudomonas sp. 681]MDI2590032.1 phage tail tape measure protein [Pseudomonas sp. 681]
MSTTFASLGIEVNSSQAVKAADDLDKLVDSAVDAEKAIDDLGKTGSELADTGKKIVQAEKEVAQEIDKSTGATQRQADARRKSGASATSEIAIISQLDKAMSGSIGSIEQLTQAEGLLERARKGGLVTIEQQEAYQDRLGKAYDKIDKAEAKEIAQKQKLIDAENRQIEALKRTVNGIDPVTAKLAKLEAQEKAAHEAFRLGAIDVDAYNVALAKVGKDRASMGEAASAFDKLKLGTRQAQENVVQLGNALSSGDWGSGVRAVAQLGAGAGASAAGLLAVLAPLALATAAVGGLAYAYYKGSEEQDAYSKGLILTGNFAGVSAAQLGDMARQVSATNGTTGEAAASLAKLAASGVVAGGSFKEIADAAAAMEDATGKSVDATVAEFVKIAKDPVGAAKELNDQYNFLTAAVYSQIVALKEQGDTVGAADLLTKTYADTIQERSRQVTDNLGTIEKAWKGIKDAAADALDATLNVGRAMTLEQQAQVIRDRLATNKGRGGRAAALGLETRDTAKDQGDLTYLELQIDAEKARNGYLGDRTRIQKEGVDAEQRLKQISDSNLSNAEKRDKLTKAYLRDVEALRKANPDDPKVQADYVAKTLQNIKDKNKDPAAAAGSVDLSGFNDAKNQLASIVAEYSNAQKQLDAAQKAGLISQAEYAQKRDGLIGNERDEVTAAYEAEIAALEAVKNKSSTTAAQRIQLDQKIADARTAMVKAQKDADSQQGVLATAEKGRLDKQTYAISQYVAALGQQQKALELAGQRAVNGVGQGDRQNALNGELNSQQDRFAQQALDLENQRSDPSRNMSDEEFTHKSQALADANKKATDQIRQNYADVEAAQGDWTKGATSAWANYLDSARNVAGQTKNLFGNAFSSMEDSIVNFAMTGKLSFADFTKSILADMARIATRQASSALLGSLVGAATSYFTGGSSAGSTQAGYTGTDLSNFTPGSVQANGGAWSGGVQMFANGGAFTNGVVNTPTSFGMAGGKTGVMGEAGPEAIMPLTRTASGALGVRALGGGSGGGTTISVQVVVASDGSTSSKTDDPAYEQFGKDLADFVDQRYQKLVSQDLRQGGKINRAIKG